MKEITRDVVQGFIARKAKSLSSKSVKNCIALLGEMWQVAKIGGYTQIDPFVALRLPEPELLDEPALSIEEMKLIIDSAPEPFKTFCWILAETGIRCGEACALPVSKILVDLGAIRITQSTWQQTIQTVKSKKGNRLCEISPQLTEHLRAYLRSWRPNRLGLLFVTKNGTPWDQNTVRRRKLYPLLAKLRIEKCGFHAFRHGNETVMDSQNVPMATRVNRLGHSNVQTTMRYTHVVSEDGRQIAATLGKLLTSRAMLAPAGNA